MVTFLKDYWGIILFVGGAFASSVIAMYQVKKHEQVVTDHENKIGTLEIGMTKLEEKATTFDYHLNDRRKNPVRTIDGCHGERDACPLRGELEKDRQISSIENSAVTSSLLRMEVLNKERHTEILTEFNLHRKTHADMDHRFNDLSEKVAVLYEKIHADRERKHNERKGDLRD